MAREPDTHRPDQRLDGDPTMARSFRVFLLVASVAFLIAFTGWSALQLQGASGIVMAGDRGPIGGDFINLWTAGRMVLDGQVGDIYSPNAFMEFQQTLVDAPIGVRLWAYPPHSLMMAWPFGLIGYLTALTIWSVLGLAALGFGARRFGFDWTQTIVLVLSPAALLCVFFGQTGNLAAGMLLLALSPPASRNGVAVGATAALTIKPQMGFMLPVLWVMSRQWHLILMVFMAGTAVFGLSIGLFGWDAWNAYLFETLPYLNELERTGTGPFVYMIPSFFMAVRIVTDSGDLAPTVHLIIAAILFAGVGRMIWRSRLPAQRHAFVLIGTAAISPYLHIYDLSFVLAAALLVAQMWSNRTEGDVWMERMVLLAWALPYVTYVTNLLGFPISPLLLLGLLWLAARAPVRSGRPLGATG